MISSSFQKLIYETLLASPAIVTAVESRVVDRASPNTRFPFISFGPVDTVIDPSDDCMDLRTEAVQIDVWSASQAGKRACKDLCDLVLATVLAKTNEVGVVAGAGALDGGELVELRSVALRIFDEPDGTTIHGVITLEGLLDGDGGS